MRGFHIFVFQNLLCDLSCLLANTAAFSMAVMNYILFTHTWLVPVIATVIKQTYLVQGRP